MHLTVKVFIFPNLAEISKAGNFKNYTLALKLLVHLIKETDKQNFT